MMTESRLNVPAIVPRNITRILVVAALLIGLIAPFALPGSVSAGVARGLWKTSHTSTLATSLPLYSPTVSTADVDAGAILVAQLVAVSDESVSDVWICPVQSGWTQVERVADASEIVQQIWWRPVSAPQGEVEYTFKSRAGSSCSVGSDISTSLSGGVTVYSGVDTVDPIGAVASSANIGTATSANAPAISSTHPAGSRVARYFAIARNRDFGGADPNRLYSDFASSSPRTIVAFDSVLSAEGSPGAYLASWTGASFWVTTTVVLHEPSVAEEPGDTTPPTSSVSAGGYLPGTWTNAPVTIDLSATDTDGSSVKEIDYSATGAQPIDMTTVAGATATVPITAEGVTTVSYFARDTDGNSETPQTFVVQIDATSPSLTGAIVVAPNANGWHNDAVTIVWACGDELSGILGGCPADSVVSSEGVDLGAGASVSDNAGNQATASVTGIQIDRTPPLTDISPIPGWSESAVTLTLAPSDNLSGVVATYYTVNGGPQQPGSQITLSQSGVHTLQYWSVDAAGNEEAPRTAEIRIDTNAPTIAHTLSPEPNAAGWNNTPVTVTFICDDAPSGIASCTEARTLTTDGANQVVTGTAVDLAGNAATDSAVVNIDQTAPEIHASRTLEPNASGWSNATVSVTFQCADATSGVLDCAGSQTVGEGVNQSVSGTATDLAGNSASATIDGINVDLTPPTITADLRTADGHTYVPGTWVNQPVTVTFACDDGLSGIASCQAPQTLGEGSDQHASGIALDLAGNAASVTIERINVDLTLPTIVASLTTTDGQPYVPGAWTSQAVTVTFTCVDALSGISSCAPPRTFGTGADQSVTGSATDAAGNAMSTTVGPINIDLTGPTIVATATTADGEPYVSGTWTNQTVTVAFTCDDIGSGLAGSCPGPVVVSDSVPLAGQAVSGQVSDLAGRTATSQPILVMVDTELPAFTSVPGDLEVEASGPEGAVVEWQAPTANDAVAGAVTPVCDAASGSTFPIGQTTVTCAATDLAGNVATASFMVTVNEAPPVVNVPEPMVVPADGPNGAIVHYAVTMGENTSRVASAAACAPSSGSLFPIGTTMVQCGVSNELDASPTASFSVTVLGASDLLTILRADTDRLVTNRSAERTLLMMLDLARVSLSNGNTLRAYVAVQQYRVLTIWYTRLGRITPSAAEPLQAQTRQVINALW